MATDIRMPQLSLTMTEGTISRWLKQVGEPVERGEPLYFVETDKVVNEVESPATGIVREIRVLEGESAPIQAVIAVIAAPGEPAGVGPDLLVPGQYEPSARVTAKTALGTAHRDEAGRDAAEHDVAHASESAVSEPTRERVFVSPRARRAAAELGIPLAEVLGTGPGARIMEKDVNRRAAARAEIAARPTIAPAIVLAPSVASPVGGTSAALAATAGYRAYPLIGQRATIARRLHASQAAAASVTLTIEVEMGEVARLRAQANVEWSRGAGEAPDRLTFTDVIAKAVAHALGDHPRLNSTLVATSAGEEIREHDRVGLGVAVALTGTGGEGGLIVPVVSDAGSQPLRMLSRQIRDLSSRARAGQLRPAEVTGGTFTLTSLGPTGIEIFTPIINAPECAILGVGNVADQPVARDGQVIIRPKVWLSLTFDHRVVDGHPAALFLARVRQLLENPYLLFI